MSLDKVAQRKVADKRLETLSHFCLSAHGNYIILRTESAKDNYGLQLVYRPTEFYRFPFDIEYIPIPEEKPLTELIKNIPLDVIYSKTVDPLLCQELSLEPTYVTECTTEKIVSMTSQSAQGKIPLQDGTLLMGSLNAFGALKIYKADYFDPVLFETLVDVSEFILSKVYPGTEEDVKTYETFKEYIGKRWIVCFAWGNKPKQQILYLGTAFNYLICICWDEETQQLNHLFSFDTGMDRLSFIKVFHDFCLIANPFGCINLYRINQTGEGAPMELTAKIWSKKDHLGCSQADVEYCDKFNGFVIVFAKGAHLVTVRVTKDGALIDWTHVNTHCGKITGFVALNSAQYIAATIAGRVVFVQMNFFKDYKQISLNQRFIDIALSGKHFQIISFVATQNKSLFVLVQHRSKEFIMLSKKKYPASTIKVFTLSEINFLKEIVSLNVKSMDGHLDYLAALRANLIRVYSKTYQNLDKYFGFLNRQDSLEANNHNLKIVQIRHTIFRVFYHYERVKFSGYKDSTDFELHYLQCRLLLTHIFLRLDYLSSLDELTDFQRAASRAMIKMFRIYNADLLEAFDEEEENPLWETAQKFVETISLQYMNLLFGVDYGEDKERCVICNEELEDDETTCSENHSSIICPLTSKMITPFSGLYCKHCNQTYHDNVEEIQELYEEKDYPKCIYCDCYLTQS